MSVSVIICAYTEKRWAELVAAVESVRNQTTPPGEIILVIDHNLGLLERASSYFPDVSVFANQEARGLSGARNSGVAAAQGNILAFIDEDAVAEPDWLAWLLKGYSSPLVLGVGGAILPWWVDQQPGWFPEEFHWVVGCTYLGLPPATAPVRNLIGANMSFRSDVFHKVGGFTNGIGRVGTLPVGCEETELCIRATQQFPEGFFLYEPQARVRHRVPLERTRWRYFFNRCYSEGLSKALVTHSVGSRRGLASERAYTFRTLPLGVYASAVSAISQRDPTKIGRAAAIIAGLLVTTWGYVQGIWFGRKGTRWKGSIQFPVIHQKVK